MAAGHMHVIDFVLVLAASLRLLILLSYFLCRQSQTSSGTLKMHKENNRSIGENSPNLVTPCYAARVARFFLVQNIKTGKIYQMATKYT
jgi:hypothetical protein